MKKSISLAVLKLRLLLVVGIIIPICVFLLLVNDSILANLITKRIISNIRIKINILLGDIVIIKIN